MMTAALLLNAALIGCGSTREHLATEQLVLSDAVDRSVSSIDFRPLSGQKVYLDTSYLRTVKGPIFVNADYVTSSLRQQIVAAGCLLQDSSNEADLIVEARMGALGTDEHRVTYGLPENNALQSAASLFPNTPIVPTLPEISVAKRDALEAAAKIAVFAYDRETRRPVWQSGVKKANATARDTWVLGVGPFQGGSIREKTKLARNLVSFGDNSDSGSPFELIERPPVDYTAQTRFQDGYPVLDNRSPAPGMMHTDEEESEMLAGDPPQEDLDPKADTPSQKPKPTRIAEQPKQDKINH